MPLEILGAKHISHALDRAVACRCQVVRLQMFCGPATFTRKAGSSWCPMHSTAPCLELAFIQPQRLLKVHVGVGPMDHMGMITEP